MRLDKFLVECGVGSRSEVKKNIAIGKVYVDGAICKDNSRNIDEMKTLIEYAGKKVLYKEFRYYKLYKIDGYITATEDKKEKTVMDLLPEWVNKKDLFPVGRLDKDTEGLLMFTNDGKLAHELISPKKHVDKIYRVILKDEIFQEGIKNLESGVDIGGYITQPAKVEKVSSKEILLNIKEGKFHQVKKMLKAIDNEVIYLKREVFGKLTLEDMVPKEVREIEREDII
ncbi:pseudouridine synthase [uncultured Cetobacterium sp.]|uniref:pseudouridine synthase n=1 Tax=uncultured Cetobacterium sp. TaxID=527638 RepID=UPI0026184CA4|nr:pseudouridine synthase [uncultured Cetobacterium sp.]